MEHEHEFYMGFAVQAAKASRAQRNKVGAVVVKDGNIIAFGYNGTPRGFDNECEVWNEQKQEYVSKREVLHAESNALAKCAQSTLSSKDADLYITTSPCFECAKLIIQSGIARVFYLNEYRMLEGIMLLTKAGVYTEQIKLHEDQPAV